MLSWMNKLVLVLAIAVMPMQGIAATLAAVLCSGEAQTFAMHEQDGHDHGTQHHSQNDDGSTSDQISHLCCHHVVSGVLVSMPPPAIPDFPALTSAPQLLHDLFLPDRPQRPPLA